MKIKVFCLIIAYLTALAASAQDVITKTDGTTINAKVAEITETTIKYYRFDKPAGPLYNVSISSVSSIKYEDGTIDTFNKEVPNPKAKTAIKVHPETPEDPQQQQVSDNTLLRMYNQDQQVEQQQQVSDAALLQMYNQKGKKIKLKSYKTPQNYLNTSRKYKSTGIIGGISIAALCCIIDLASYHTDEWGAIYAISDDFPALAIGGVLIGGIWMGSWCLAATYQRNKAYTLHAYSVPVFEDEILAVGDKTLTAGVNLMGNNITNTRGIGVGLIYTF